MRLYSEKFDESGKDGLEKFLIRDSPVFTQGM